MKGGDKMPQTSTICRLTFATDIDRDRILRVPDPAEDITATDVSEAAQQMILANVFDPETGSLTELNRAEIITWTERPLF